MVWSVYAQRNVPGLAAVPWANQRLGWCNNVTIGSDGCYVCAMCQVAKRFEHDINPANLDNRFTGPDPAHTLYGGACHDLMFDNNLQKVFPDIRYVETKNWAGPADLGYFVMADNEEIIIGLDNLNKGSVSRHFARVWGYTPATGVLLIDDPWWGRTLDFRAMYGNPRDNIMKAVKYRRDGWVPPEKRVAAPPAAPAAPTVPAPAAALTESAVRALLLANGVAGANADLAVAVCHAESGFRPDAKNTAGNTPPSVDRGLWQINSYWHPEVSDACAYDPACATKEAVRIAKGGTDWSAWSAFTSGAYKQFLPAPATVPTPDYHALYDADEAAITAAVNALNARKK